MRNFFIKLAQWDGTRYLQSSLKKLAVSESFEILELTPSLREICSKIDDFVIEECLNWNEQYKYDTASVKDITDYNIQLTSLFVNMALDKYKQLVLPYIDSKGFNFNYNQLYGPYQRRSDDFYLLLHDLIHETIRPGSNVTFRKIDDKLDKERDSIRQNILFDKDVEKITRDKIPYNLEQFIEEDIAVRLSSVRDNKSRESLPRFGIWSYVDYMMKSILNEVFGTKFMYQVQIHHWVAPGEIGMIFNFFQKLIEYIEKDIKKITNTKYKVVATEYLHSLKGWIRSLNEKILHHRVTNGINMEDLIQTILIKTLSWCSRKFNHLNIDPKDDSRREEILIDDPSVGKDLLPENVTHKESPVQSLTDERKMSLLRRWLRAVDIGVDKIITEHNRDEYNSRINMPSNFILNGLPIL